MKIEIPVAAPPPPASWKRCSSPRAMPSRKASMSPPSGPEKRLPRRPARAATRSRNAPPARSTSSTRAHHIRAPDSDRLGWITAPSRSSRIVCSTTVVRRKPADGGDYNVCLRGDLRRRRAHDEPRGLGRAEQREDRHRHEGAIADGWWSFQHAGVEGSVAIAGVGLTGSARRRAGPMEMATAQRGARRRRPHRARHGRRGDREHRRACRPRARRTPSAGPELRVEIDSSSFVEHLVRDTRLRCRGCPTPSSSRTARTSAPGRPRGSGQPQWRACSSTPRRCSEHPYKPPESAVVVRDGRGAPHAPVRRNAQAASARSRWPRAVGAARTPTPSCATR